MSLLLDIMDGTPVGVGVNALSSLLLMKQKLPRATIEESSLKVVGLPASSFALTRYGVTGKAHI